MPENPFWKVDWSKLNVLVPENEQQEYLDLLDNNFFDDELFDISGVKEPNSNFIIRACIYHTRKLLSDELATIEEETKKYGKKIVITFETLEDNEGANFKAPIIYNRSYVSLRNILYNDGSTTIFPEINTSIEPVDADILVEARHNDTVIKQDTREPYDTFVQDYFTKNNLVNKDDDFYTDNFDIKDTYKSDFLSKILDLPDFQYKLSLKDVGGNYYYVPYWVLNTQYLEKYIYFDPDKGFTITINQSVYKKVSNLLPTFCHEIGHAYSTFTNKYEDFKWQLLESFFYNPPSKGGSGHFSNENIQLNSFAFRNRAEQYIKNFKENIDTFKKID